jgi:hypothetical protein
MKSLPNAKMIIDHIAQKKVIENLFKRHKAKQAARSFF